MFMTIHSLHHSFLHFIFHISYPPLSNGYQTNSAPFPSPLSVTVAAADENVLESKLSFLLLPEGGGLSFELRVVVATPPSIEMPDIVLTAVVAWDGVRDFILAPLLLLLMILWARGPGSDVERVMVDE